MCVGVDLVVVGSDLDLDNLDMDSWYSEENSKTFLTLNLIWSITITPPVTIISIAWCGIFPHHQPDLCP